MRVGMPWFTEHIPERITLEYNKYIHSAVDCSEACAAYIVAKQEEPQSGK